jgi:hypothetical protein
MRRWKSTRLVNDCHVIPYGAFQVEVDPPVAPDIMVITNADIVEDFFA